MPHAFITGVSRGLGLVIAKRLLADGWTVHGVSRSDSPELQQLVAASAGRCIHQQLDLGDPAALEGEAAAAVMPLDTPVHGLVNNAAVAHDDLITNYQAAPLEHLLRVNVLAPMLLTRRFLRNCLLHHTAGSIVHISSVSAHTGYKGLAAYAASKAALEAFSRTAAREWGERGIRSNCVVAGFMDTDMTAALDSGQKRRIHGRTALKRAVDPADIAAMVAHLLGPDSGSITGQALGVDCGTL
jgi:3-oxoacyl-[acyl-carrier protein] reductase